MRTEFRPCREGLPMHLKNLKIDSADCGDREEMSLVTLLDRFQESANEAASKLGASVPQILPLGFTWMLVKYRLRAERLPRPGETLSLRTWHFPHGRLYSLRAFELFSGASRIVRAETCWVLVDLERRKPFQIQKGLPNLHEEENPAIPFEFGKVEPIAEGPWHRNLQVEDRDIDDNGHVNHVRYLDWAVATIPAEWQRDRAFRGFDAEYHAEGLPGDLLETACKPEDMTTAGLTCLHGIHRPADKAELFRMRTMWA